MLVLYYRLTVLGIYPAAANRSVSQWLSLFYEEELEGDKSRKKKCKNHLDGEKMKCCSGKRKFGKKAI